MATRGHVAHVRKVPAGAPGSTAVQYLDNRGQTSILEYSRMEV